MRRIPDSWDHSTRATLRRALLRGIYGTAFAPRGIAFPFHHTSEMHDRKKPIKGHCFCKQWVPELLRSQSHDGLWSSKVRRGPTLRVFYHGIHTTSHAWRLVRFPKRGWDANNSDGINLMCVGNNTYSSIRVPTSELWSRSAVAGRSPESHPCDGESAALYTRRNPIHPFHMPINSFTPAPPVSARRSGARVLYA